MTLDDAEKAAAVARAALAEVGHPGAVYVTEGCEIDEPGPPWYPASDAWPVRQNELAWALVLGHRAVGHDAWVDEVTWPGYSAVVCTGCWHADADLPRPEMAR